MKDELNKEHGRLTVIARSQEKSWGSVKWICRCSCGNEIEVSGAHLRSGHTESCGCLQKDRASSTSRRHGEGRDGKMSAVYRIWISMRQRCSNPNDRRYRTYAGRGIAVCDRWQVYENFRDDMGPRPEGCSIDRIDNDKGYEPGNCRWATRKEQARNKRATVYVTHNGETKPLVQWCEELGLDKKAYGKIYERKKAGVPEHLLLTPGRLPRTR